MCLLIQVNRFSFITYYSIFYRRNNSRSALIFARAKSKFSKQLLNKAEETVFEGTKKFILQK